MGYYKTSIVDLEISGTVENNPTDRFCSKPTIRERKRSKQLPGWMMWVSTPKLGGKPQNGWFFIRENPYEQMDDLGGFVNTPIFGLTPMFCWKLGSSYLGWMWIM